MFEARFEEGSIFKELINVLKVTQDANLDCSAEKLSIQGMDPTHVYLMKVTLWSNGFDHYRCDRDCNLGVNFASLSKLLSCTGNDDIITLKYEDAADALSLTLEAPNQNRKSECELNLSNNNESELLGIPEFNYLCIITMPSTEFKKIITDMQEIGKNCVICCSEEGIRFSVTGEIGTQSVLLCETTGHEKDENEISIDMERPVELTFSLKYLNHIIKSSNLSQSVILRMSRDVPICVEYPINEETGHIRYYLAPKVEA